MKKNLYYRVMRVLSMIWFTILYRPKIVGRENIPKEGRCVLAGNHTKFLDPIMMIAYCKRELHFLSKKELFDKWFRFHMIGMGCIPVDRSKKDKSVFDNANKVLQEDGAIAIFPEGTINRTDDTIMKFKIGAVKMASDNDAVIVPFVITGKYRLFGIGKRIKLEYLEPISIGKDLDKENERLMKIVREKLEEENEKK